MRGRSQEQNIEHERSRCSVPRRKTKERWKKSEVRDRRPLDLCYKFSLEVRGSVADAVFP